MTESPAVQWRSRLGRIGVWAHLDGLAAAEMRGFVRRVEALGYDGLWVPETVGREPYALLGALTRETQQMMLGTSIASIWGHDAMSTRMAAMTLHELSGGRFLLGLGVSHLHLAQKLRGHVYDKPVTRMREYLAAYRRLPYRGPTLDEPQGLGEPPVLIAALRARMLTLAATDADGAFPYLVTPERVTWMRALLGREAGAAGPGGRPSPLLAVTLPVVLEADAGTARAAARGYLTPYLRTPNYQASWAAQGFAPADWAPPGSDRLVDAMVAWGDVATLRERLATMHSAGADHVALIALAPDGTTEHLPTLEALAEARPADPILRA
ncbi:MAG: TIGR03620 family F420-dependent LLM class oxidoreductase [Chloroflexi bacterium]|nr:TIGR03620 family F420-dependent LLM class oxidoreductase [Chloroflexota bacterium]